MPCVNEVEVMGALVNPAGYWSLAPPLYPLYPLCQLLTSYYGYRSSAVSHTWSRFKSISNDWYYERFRIRIRPTPVSYVPSLSRISFTIHGDTKGSKSWKFGERYNIICSHVRFNHHPGRHVYATFPSCCNPLHWSEVEMVIEHLFPEAENFDAPIWIRTKFSFAKHVLCYPYKFKVLTSAITTRF